MTRIITRELTVTFRVVEKISDDDHDKPSLPPMPGATVYTTDGEEVTTSVRGPVLRKALPSKARRLAAGER